MGTQQTEAPHSKLWGGRFTGKTDPVMEAFNASISFDKRMWKEDLLGSKAYAKAINMVGLLTNDECRLIVDGLDAIEKEWEHGSFVLKEADEDIHTANERRLKELIGPVGGKLHTGRSRNDQAATDTRMWLREQMKEIVSLLQSFLTVLVRRAEVEIDLLMPGYTHLQRAQPIRWSHWLLNHGWALQSDVERLRQALPRVNTLPLGCGALAGNPFNVDRDFLARELAFEAVAKNSLEGTSGRDFVAEFMFCCSLLMVHLSRWAEDLILYSSKEFGFVSLSDAYSTGSSLMPQKKNPDSLELIRGKSGRIQGNYVGFMMTLKGLPSAYNKDLQEDKEPLFDTVDTVIGVLKVACGTLSTLSVNAAACREALTPDMLATDLAYYLVRKGLPFRDAHSMAGSIVHLSERRGVPLTELSVESMKTVCPLVEEDVRLVWDFESSVEQYQSVGGTSKSSVLQQIDSLKSLLS